VHILPILNHMKTQADQFAAIVLHLVCRSASLPSEVSTLPSPSWRRRRPTIPADSGLAWYVEHCSHSLSHRQTPLMLTTPTCPGCSIVHDRRLHPHDHLPQGPERQSGPQRDPD
jgi:hypothetical protein